jgi:hypothetical protein
MHDTRHSEQPSSNHAKTKHCLRRQAARKETRITSRTNEPSQSGGHFVVKVYVQINLQHATKRIVIESMQIA